MTYELTTAPICCATEGGGEREFGCEFEPQKRGGIQGIVDAYHQILLQIRLYRPTNFFPIINHMARFAAHLLQQGTAAAPQEALSQVVLAEVPKQLVSYNEWQEWPPLKLPEIKVSFIKLPLKWM